MAGRLARDDRHCACGFLELDTSAGAGKGYERYFFVLDVEEKQFRYYKENPQVSGAV